LIIGVDQHLNTGQKGEGGMKVQNITTPVPGIFAFTRYYGISLD
jgi:hypothetical protein